MNDTQLSQWYEQATALESEVKNIVIGQATAIHLITIAIFSRGHVLLEGDVGVGKPPCYALLHGASVVAISA